MAGTKVRLADVENEYRWVACTECNGDGGFESMPHGVNHINGQPITRWLVCGGCGGTGEFFTPCYRLTAAEVDALVNEGWEAR